jgi:hypothetical protein
MNPSPVRETVSRPRCVRASSRRMTHRYRVLRVTSRGVVRSVDREDAGRNASEGIEPRQTGTYVVVDQVWSREDSTEFAGHVQTRPQEQDLRMNVPERDGTTGVQVHGMYLQLVSEPGRSPRHAESESNRNTREQGLKTKFVRVGGGEVRCHRSSWEVG